MYPFSYIYNGVSVEDHWIGIWFNLIKISCLECIEKASHVCDPCRVRENDVAVGYSHEFSCEVTRHRANEVGLAHFKRVTFSFVWCAKHLRQLFRFPDGEAVDVHVFSPCELSLSYGLLSPHAYRGQYITTYAKCQWALDKFKVRE